MTPSKRNKASKISEMSHSQTAFIAACFLWIIGAVFLVISLIDRKLDVSGFWRKHETNYLWSLYISSSEHGAVTVHLSSQCFHYMNK